MKINHLLLAAGLLVPAFSFASTAKAERSDAPRPTKVVEPAYPEIARMTGTEGTIIVEALVDAEGNVIATGSTDKNTDARLRQAALDAVANWTFEPLGDRAENGFVVVRVPIVFELTTNPLRLDTSRIAGR